MKKPIIRWTIGHVKKSGYEILSNSIKNIKKLYSDEFEYCVCHNDADKKEMENLKKTHKVNFIEQKWEDCPIKNLKRPKKIDEKTKQKINGSFWKICPPRLSKDTHEIILDNDLIFLKKPKIIEEFLSVNNKNLIIKDSNIYLGIYEHLFDNEKQGYNSGVIGLHPGYDFQNDIIKNIVFIEGEENLNYGQEQGLLMYSLYKTNPLIGSSENFVGIHPDIIYLNCISGSDYILDKQNDTEKNKFIKLNKNLLKKVFNDADVVHFLMSNRKRHKAWEYFKFNKKYL
jgi:signal peptidase I